MSPTLPVRIAVLPAGEVASLLVGVVADSGASPTDDAKEADAVVWCSPNPDGLDEVLGRARRASWVQVPFAGVERFLPLMDDGRIWTCTKEVYGPNVAELALGLLITAFRRLDRYACARTWQRLPQRSLEDAEILVLGGGGIGTALTSLLVSLRARVTVATRSGREVAAARAVAASDVHRVLPAVDACVLAVPLTPETHHLVDAGFLSLMKPSAWLVNVARGKVVATDDLVEALRGDVIAGAALDVTDPEPLPDGHPLWDLENALITPHVANTEEVGIRALADLVRENCRRFVAGQPLRGVVDAAAGY